MKKIKLLVFILLIIFLLVIFLFGMFGNSLSYLSSKEIKQTRKLNKNLINNLKINNADAVYDKKNNIYYYMISEKFENNNYVLKLELDNNLKYKIVGETFNIIKVDYSKQYVIIIYSDEEYYQTKIQLTNLPLINIETEKNITTNDTNSVFNYINTNLENKVLINNSKIKIRGASSQKFDKKSYKINMYDKNYIKEKEINISNFYYGNSFVLDAIYRDPSKIRNVLCIELWNRFSDDFSNIDINSEFVELFINNEYKGLYVLTEPINRRKLNLNKSSKTDTSIILKVQHWFSLNSDSDFSNITSDSYSSYELKYPNDEELYAISWETILSKMSKYYDLSYKSKFKIINSVWNMENYIDMIIFNAFVNNSDNNMNKNNYFYMKSINEDEIFIQPWDMEYSFGLQYSSVMDKNTLKKMQDYNKIYTKFYHKNSYEINNLLIKRYWELRKNVLTEEYFNSLLYKYKNELTKGASSRDSKLWYKYDIEKEIEEIRVWLHNRLEFFDSYIRGIENE